MMINEFQRIISNLIRFYQQIPKCQQLTPEEVVGQADYNLGKVSLASCINCLLQLYL